MVKVLFDANIIQDLLESRLEFPNSTLVLNYAYSGLISGYISANKVPILLCVNRKERRIRETVSTLLTPFTIVDLTGKAIVSAFNNARLSDFEDELQLIAAETAECDYLVTRDIHYFKQIDSPVKLITPEECVRIVSTSDSRDIS